MTNEEAAAMLESMKNYFLPTSPMLENRREITALDLAISVLSKRSASSEQVCKDIKFPTIHCCRGYDSIKDENGRMGFGVYDPQEKNIYIAGDVPKEIFLKALFHEVFHWVQDVAGMKFDEDDANSFSDILYNAVDMFDDHGPELFGQKAIVEPGEMFVGENVLKEALDDQFREDTKKTEDALLNRYDVIKAVDRHTREDGTLDDDISCILEEVSPFEQKNSNSFSKEPPAEGNSEMNCSDVPDIHVGKTDFQPGDKFILELGEERRMFGEFEIKGTDLYVKTDLIEKLRRFDPDYMGEWIFHADWKRLGYAPYECNWCGRAFDYEMNYCGYCGAYMKRKAK